MAHIESRATPRILISIARATALSQRNRLIVTPPSSGNDITPARDGDYEPQSAANHQTLRVNDQNQLICRPTPRRVTWTIEPRGFEAYLIGNAADALAIQLPRNGSATVVIQNNRGRQRCQLIEADTSIEAPMLTPKNIAGFPTRTYLEIRARGSENVLLTYNLSNEDGAQIQLFPRPVGSSGDRVGLAYFNVAPLRRVRSRH